MVFTENRLVRIKQFVGVEVSHKMEFDNMFFYFGYERKITDWTISLIFIRSGFLEEWRDDRFFENGMKQTGGEKQVNNVGYFRNKYAFFEKPSSEQQD